MGFDPRHWRPYNNARPVTGAIEALQAENDALRREVRSLRLQLELLLEGSARSAASGAPAAAAGRRPSSRHEPSDEPIPRRSSHGISRERVDRWGAALARHPRWHTLRLGPPGGLRGLLEQLRSRAWNPDLSFEEQLDRQAAGLGTELAAALRGPQSRGRLAVRAAFALYGPRAIEWLSEEPHRVVEELLRRSERLGERAPGPRRGTRTENHSHSREAPPPGHGNAPPSPGGDGGTSSSRGPRAASGAGSGRSHRAADPAGEPGSHSRNGHEHAGERCDGRGSGGGAGTSRQHSGGSQQAGRSEDNPGSSRTSGSHRGGATGADPRQQALALLGLESGASPQAIKRAYRRLAKAHHPDLGGDVEAFHRLDAAYRLLL
jgi:DnaJ domain